MSICRNLNLDKNQALFWAIFGVHSGSPKIVLIKISYYINDYYVAAFFYFKLYCKSILYRICQFVAIKIWTKIMSF